MGCAFGVRCKKSLPRVLVLFHGEWHVETKISALGMLTAVREWMFPGPQWTEPQRMCVLS